MPALFERTQNRMRKDGVTIKKNLSTLSICHLILMAVVGLMSCASAVIIFSGHIPEGYEVVTDAHKNASLFMGFGHTVNVLALVCGIIYMLKGSGKDVAGLYKAFLLLVTLGLALRLVGRLIFPGFDAVACLIIGSLIMLLILTFVKDLGRSKTLGVYYVLLALDLVAAILLFDKREMLSSIASGLTRLVLDGSIGLAIWAKYKDKAARGR